MKINRTGQIDQSGAPSGGTRERLLESALTLMRKSGLSGAGINEVVRESGAPKGSVYHFFPDGKEQIVTEALSVHSERVAHFIEAAMSPKRTPAAKVKALFDAFAERFEQGGFEYSCPAGTVCLDLQPDSKSLRHAVAASLDHYLHAIADQLESLGRPRATALAGVALSAIEGAYVRGRAARSSAPFREAGAWLSQLARLTSATSQRKQCLCRQFGRNALVPARHQRDLSSTNR